jgi:hypothetical protein
VELAGKKIIKTKYDGLDGKTKVSFVTDDNESKFVADKSSLAIDLHVVIEDRTQLDELAQVIGAAWTEKEKMQPKLHKSLSGH